MFLFLFAGHETTAHSVAFTLGLLALYPEEQRKVVDQIQELQQEKHDFVRDSRGHQYFKLELVFIQNYEDLSKYTYTLAVLYEALRLYPIVCAVIT